MPVLIAPSLSRMRPASAGDDAPTLYRDTLKHNGECARTSPFWEWAKSASELRLPIAVRLPLARVAEACALMRRNAHFGKIVLTPSGS